MASHGQTEPTLDPLIVVCDDVCMLCGRDQEETFMVPELGMDMFDTAMPLFQPEIDLPQAAIVEEMVPAPDAVVEEQLGMPEIPIDAEAIVPPEPVHEEMLDPNGEALSNAVHDLCSALKPQCLEGSIAMGSWQAYGKSNSCALSVHVVHTALLMCFSIAARQPMWTCMDSHKQQTIEAKR